MDGLGVEVAKCIALAGIGHITLYDPVDMVTMRELSSNYYLNQSDVGKSKVEKLRQIISYLNTSIMVDRLDHIVTEKLNEFDVVVCCNMNVFDLIHWNKYCRINGVRFIALRSYGLVGSVFCDFGSEYIVTDADGEPMRSGIVTEVKGNVFRTSETHHMYTGDCVVVSGIEGVGNEMMMIHSTGSHTFLLKPYDEKLCYGRQTIIVPNQIPINGSYKMQKMPTIMRFNSLEDQLKNPQFVMFDMMDWDRPKILHVFMKSLDIWSKSKITHNIDEQFPRPHNEEDFQELWKLFSLEYQSTFPNKDNLNNGIKQLVRTICYQCAGRLCPIDSVIGSIGAQEVVKACSGKFTPTIQFLHFDSLNVLPNNYTEPNFDEYCGLVVDKMYGQRLVFGNNFMDKLNSTKCFVVGAGAIGSEHLKNMAMMGIGKITVTDPDHIELSNLSRQFLFRTTDIGKSKSIIGCEKAKEMNPNVEMIAQENKVCAETADQYDHKFFGNVDVVLNALDNVEARLFVDQLCRKYSKPLLESGTLGTKGNIQTIIPMLTESYGSLRDPPEQNIPVCTLKLFPSTYNHVVQYSRDLFEGWFGRIPANYQRAQKPEQLEQLTPTELLAILEDCKTIRANSLNFKNCINMAYKEFYRLFRDQPNAIAKKYPIDHEENGQKFWSGSKRFPRPIEFDHSNPLHLDLIISFSNIWADCCGITLRYPSNKRDQYIKFLERLQPPPETLFKDIDQHKEEETAKSDHAPEALNKLPTHDPVVIIREITNIVKAINKDAIKTTPFEKDDESNHHIDLIYSLSNLRAINYQITPMTKLETKGIAGKIIPALATTTSLVSGLVSLELYKVIFATHSKEQYNSLDRYRTGSFNLAVQVFGFTTPYGVHNTMINGKNYNIWTVDNYDGDMTLEELVNQYKEVELENVKSNGEVEAVDMDVGFISHGNDMIYNTMQIRPTIRGGAVILKKKLREIITTKPTDEVVDICVNLEPTDCDRDDFNDRTDTIIRCRINL